MEIFILKFVAFKRNNGNQAILIQYVDSCFFSEVKQGIARSFFCTVPKMLFMYSQK
jgi:hypothetical protein